MCKISKIDQFMLANVGFLTGACNAEVKRWDNAIEYWTGQPDINPAYIDWLNANKRQFEILSELGRRGYLMSDTDLGKLFSEYESVKNIAYGIVPVARGVNEK